MCDYSLEGIQSRLAEENENLALHEFSTGSRGLISPQNLSGIVKGLVLEECAVCIPDGAKLEVQLPRKTRRILKLSKKEKETVTFRQRSMMAFGYRDAIEFEGHPPILLQNPILPEGLIFNVVSLDHEEESSQEGIQKKELELTL